LAGSPDTATIIGLVGLQEEHPFHKILHKKQKIALPVHHGNNRLKNYLK